MAGLGKRARAAKPERASDSEALLRTLIEAVDALPAVIEARLDAKLQAWRAEDQTALGREIREELTSGLGRLRAQQHAQYELICEELHALVARLPQPRVDATRCGALLAAIVGAGVREPWTAAALLECAEDDIALRSAIAVTLGREPKNAARRLGSFLAAHVGVESGGLRLERTAGRRAAGIAYFIVLV